MIIITGGAGFIGSNIVKKLNEKGRHDIIVVDNLTNGTKFKNLADCIIADYFDKEDFLQRILSGKNLGSIEAIIHQGACSVTTEWDGRYMMRNNFEYSKTVLHYCLANKIPFIYASSAATYGASTQFKEQPEFEVPLNVYGYSKLVFDQYVRQIMPQAKSQIAGFRYFNVYGPRENHKGSMASVAFHLYKQVQADKIIKLFAGCDGYADGEQRRDFIFIEDVVDVNLWFLANPNKSGIFNVGTGRSEPFNAIANTILEQFPDARLEYTPFPEKLRGRYQSFTQADISQLRAAGYNGDFHTVAEGTKKYLAWLLEQKEL